MVYYDATSFVFANNIIYFIHRVHFLNSKAKFINWGQSDDVVYCQRRRSYMFLNYGDKEKTCQEPNNDSTTTKLYVTVQMKDETKIYVYTHIFKTATVVDVVVTIKEYIILISLECFFANISVSISYDCREVFDHKCYIARLTKKKWQSIQLNMSHVRMVC